MHIVNKVLFYPDFKEAETVEKSEKDVIQLLQDVLETSYLMIGPRKWYRQILDKWLEKITELEHGNIRKRIKVLLIELAKKNRFKEYPINQNYDVALKKLLTMPPNPIFKIDYAFLSDEKLITEMKNTCDVECHNISNYIEGESSSKIREKIFKINKGTDKKEFVDDYLSRMLFGVEKVSGCKRITCANNYK